MKTKDLFGIDLGTTYSAIAGFRDNDPYIIPTRDGPTLASAVAYRPDGRVVVGREAKKLQADGDRDVVTFTKRNMGNPHYGFPAHGRTYTPVEVSAEVLKALKADAEKHLGRAITDVVITVPAYFQAPQRDDTFAAGRLAGLNVVRLIDEPTAATLAIALAARANGRPLEGRVLVYDLGGGTFDVSVVYLPNGGRHIRVLAFKGDSYLGGKNFDDGLTNVVRAKAREQHGVELIDDPRKSSQWVALIEPFKIALSTADAIDIPVGPGDARTVRVARAEYEAVSQALLNQTVMLAEGALRDADERDQLDKRRPPRKDPLPAHLAWQQLDHVLLVGGMTRTPMVTDRLAALSRKAPRADVNPDEAVALGAACAAAIAAGELPADTLEEINAHTLGVIATARGGKQFVNSPVLPRNRPIPCTGSREYQVHTAPSAANDYTLYVTQGENRDPRSPDVKFLRKRRVRGIPHTPAGTTRITVSIGYNGNATEEVTAKTTDGTALDVVTEPVQQADVELFRTGRPPQPVAAAIATVLAVDVSGSMSSRGKLSGVQGKGKEFVTHRLRTSSGMGVVSFNGESRVVCPLTTDAGTLHAAIDSLRPFGNTYSAPALDHAFRLLAPVPGARRIVLLTDGQAADEADTEAAAERCRAAGIALHIIATQDANLPFLDRIGDLLPADDAGLGARLADIPEEVGPDPLDWGSPDAQDDPLPEMIALPPKAENLFLALDAPPDAPAADLSPRLASRQGEWTRQCDHQDPDVQTRARLRLEQVPAFRRIIETPDRLKAEADDARRLLQEAETRHLQRADELVRQYGADELCLTTPEVRKVAAQTGLPEARIRAIVADHKFDVVEPPAPPAFPLLDPVQWHRVSSNLAALGAPDLYHLLGGTPQGDPARLTAEATRLYDRLAQAGGATPDAQTQMALYAEARTLFADPDQRKRYDNSRAFAAMEPVREKIIGRAGPKKRLSFDAQTALRNDLHAAWPNAAAVDAFLPRVADAAGIFLEGKKKPGPRPPIQVRCPVCREVADEQAPKCPKGHDMFPPCPKCKTPNHVSALACGCGQNLRCRPEAEDLARLAERLFSAGNYDEAGQQAARALDLWPGLASAKATRVAVQEKVKADAALREATIARIRQAVGGKRMLAALADLALAPEDAVTRELHATATAGRDKALAKMKEGDNHLTANRPDAAFEAFEEAVAACVDLTDAQKGLMRCPAEPAGPVTVTPTAEGATLEWAPSPTRKGRVSYRVYLYDRNPGANPDGGTLIGETAEPRCAVRLPANAPHFAAVVALRDGVPNDRPTAAGPFLRPEEVAGVRAVAAPDEVTVSFNPPAGALRVEVLRADDRRPDVWGEPQVLPAGSSQYTDHTVENGRRYRYTVRAVYPLGDGTERTSAGVRCAAAPADRAEPVTDLVARVERNRTARVTFTAPPTGEVLLFAAPTPPPFPPGTPLAETDLPAFGTQVRTASGRADYPLAPGREVFFTAVSRNGGVLTAGACFPALAVDPVAPPTIRYGTDGELVAEFPWPDGADEVVILTSPTAPPKAWNDAAAARVVVPPPESGRTATCRWTVESGANEVFVSAFAIAPRPPVGDWSSRTYSSPPTTAIGGTQRTLRYVVRPVPQPPPRRSLFARLFGKPIASHSAAVVGVEVVIVPDRPTRLPDFQVRYLEGRKRPLSRTDGRAVVGVPADDRVYGPDDPRVVRESFDAIPKGEFRLFPTDETDARGWRLIDVPAE